MNPAGVRPNAPVGMNRITTPAGHGSRARAPELRAEKHGRTQAVAYSCSIVAPASGIAAAPPGTRFDCERARRLMSLRSFSSRRRAALTQRLAMLRSEEHTSE